MSVGSAEPSSRLPQLLEMLRARCLGAVGARAQQDPTATDPLRGLHLPADGALHWGSRPPASEVHDDTAGPYRAACSDVIGADDRLGRLARGFGLTPLDLHILLVAVAPDLDTRFAPLFGFLNDDVTRRRATVSLTLDLIGASLHEPDPRARFRRPSPLLVGGLLMVSDHDQPLPDRQLQVPERVVAHLLGDDGLDEVLLETTAVHEPVSSTGVARAAGDGSPGTFGDRLTRLVRTRATTTAYLAVRLPGDAPRAAVEALVRSGTRVLHSHLPSDPGEARTTVFALLREARLTGSALVIGPLPQSPVAVVHDVEVADVPVVLTDPRPFDPAWSTEGGVLVLEPPVLDRSVLDIWAEELGEEAAGIDLPATVGALRLGREQIRRSIAAARDLAAADQSGVRADHVRQGARQQGSPVLDQHARRVDPTLGWSDLVLPSAPSDQLHELVLRARTRDRVLRQWRLRPGGGRGRGVVALFAGDSGTGKTLSAEVVAGELGVSLYVVDLATVVDKYIGETEKNLDRIFTEADRTDAVLLFDEADAVFGKRSEVRDARDRYANLESAFLLQRLESFDGVAILTTNLRANIDDAFTRRLDLVVDFPFPDEALRARLWRLSLAHAPCAPDLDVQAVGSAFELSGGGIRSAAVTAAYLAAGRDGPVSMADVTAGAQREYRKSGRMVW